MPKQAETGACDYAFDDFTVNAAEAVLRRGETVVPLPSRSFDTLVCLLEHRDSGVSKSDLIAAVWPDVIVTDDSLIHAISVLRRALGDDAHDPRYIQTIPRRGYRFIGTIRPLADRQRGRAAGPAARLASTAPGAPPPHTPGSRPAWPRWATLLAVMLLAVLTGLAVVVLRPPADSGSKVSVYLYQPAPPNTEIVSAGVLSPNGRHLAFVARDRDSGQTDLWLRSLASDELRRLDGASGAAMPFWSPDSRQIAFFTGGKLQAQPIGGGPARTITTVFAAAGGSWGTDDVILFAEWANGVFAVSASGDGSPEALVTLDRDAEDIAYAWPQVFYDNRRFLYQIVSLDPARSGIYVGDRETHASFLLLAATAAATLAPPHHLLHVENDMLIAEELDPDHPELTGRAIVVARGLSEPDLATDSIVSASTDLLAFQQGVTRQDLAWYGRDGTRLEPISVPTVIYNPRLSPNGEQLIGSAAVTTNPGLWLISLDREQFVRLEQDALAPIWSADGRRIAFTSRNGFDLSVRTVDGGETARLLLRDDSVKVLNDWSAARDEIVFTRRNSETVLDLWLVDVATGQARPLLATPHNETQARISPDGRWIAFVADETGVTQIYVARFPDMSNRRMVSIAGGSQPQWRADQAELFYLASDETVMAVAASQGGTPAFGVPQPLFRANVAGNAGDARDQFAVDPAGERFLIAGESSENDSQAITVVVNWAAGMVEAADGAAQLAPLVRQQF